MISYKDFKSPWPYLWIIGTVMLYWFVAYHVIMPFKHLLFLETQEAYNYPRLFTHNYLIIFSHVLASIVVALLMPWQFLIFKVKKIRKTHKFFGYACLIASCFAAPTAIYLSYTSGNPFLTSTGNALAAAGWCIAFWIAFNYIRKRNIEKHKQWMIRTYVFFLDGAVLRIIFTEMEIFSEAGSVSYYQESWLAWLGPWILIEILFYIEKKKREKRNISNEPSI